MIFVYGLHFYRGAPSLEIAYKNMGTDMSSFSFVDYLILIDYHSVMLFSNSSN